MMSGLVNEQGRPIVVTAVDQVQKNTLGLYVKRIFDRYKEPSLFSSLGQSPILDATGQPFQHEIKGSDRIKIRTRINQEET